MNKNFKVLGLSVVAASMLFVGCGSSSSSGGSSSGGGTTSNTVSGVVSDGLISGATVKLIDESNNTISTTTSDSNGSFSFSDTLDSSKTYTIVSTGGTDNDTGEDFTGVELKAPLSMFSGSETSSVISPITSLVAEEFEDTSNITTALDNIKSKLNLSSVDMLKKEPSTDLSLQKAAMNLSLMVKEGITFDTIKSNLVGNDGIDSTDINAITSDSNKRVLLTEANTQLETSSNPSNAASIYKQQRYIREITDAGSDLNLSDTNVFTNIKALSDKFFTDDKDLTSADIVATFGSGLSNSDLNMSNSDFNTSKYSIQKVSGSLSFSDSLRTLYYTITNPKTLNDQLLAYDYDNDKAYVVNTNVILGDKTFIYGAEKSANEAVYTAKRYGLYLDPEQDSEVRTGSETVSGQTIPYTYNFYTNNALVKFEVTSPKSTSYVFKATDIPSSIQSAGVTKLSKHYEILENIVDSDNSYIKLTAYNSLPDGIKGEKEASKKQADITVRLGDSRAVAGEPIAIIKDSDMKTDSVLVAYSEPYTPNSSSGSYVLKKYNKTLTSSTTIASDGRYYYATHNDDYVYLFKENSNQLFALDKTNGTSLTAVTGIALAGNYVADTHSLKPKHGSDSELIDGASTLSGLNTSLNDGTNAYVTFHYDLHEKVGKLFVFGTFGAYKSAQVFKLTGTTGTKIFDNGDGTDESLANAVTSDPINGHINLIALNGDKLYTEIGWYDGNTTLGGSCTSKYPSAFMPTAGPKCSKIKYGYLDTTVSSSVNDSTNLLFDSSDDSLDTNMTVSDIPYYVSRRIAPLANDGKLYISLFDGGSTKSDGYKYKQYIFNLGDTNTSTVKNGRTFFVKTGESETGEYSGSVIAWDSVNDTITDDDNSTNISITTVAGKATKSISANTNGVPLSGIGGTLGMLKNNNGNHEFNLFSVDVSSNQARDVDFAPYGGWIYE